jgi:hypothetical protein
MLTTIEMKKAAIQGAQFLDAAGDLLEVKVRTILTLGTAKMPRNIHLLGQLVLDFTRLAF